jgi:hypothetical protein
MGMTKSLWDFAEGSTVGKAERDLTTKDASQEQDCSGGNRAQLKLNWRSSREEGWGL